MITTKTMVFVFASLVLSLATAVDALRIVEMRSLGTAEQDSSQGDTGTVISVYSEASEFRERVIGTEVTLAERIAQGLGVAPYRVKVDAYPVARTASSGTAPAPAPSPANFAAAAPASVVPPGWGLGLLDKKQSEEQHVASAGPESNVVSDTVKLMSMDAALIQEVRADFVNFAKKLREAAEIPSRVTFAVISPQLAGEPQPQAKADVPHDAPRPSIATPLGTVAAAPAGAPAAAAAPATAATALIQENEGKLAAGVKPFVLSEWKLRFEAPSNSVSTDLARKFVRDARRVGSKLQIFLRNSACRLQGDTAPLIPVRTSVPIGEREGTAGLHNRATVLQALAESRSTQALLIDFKQRLATAATLHANIMTRQAADAPAPFVGEDGYEYDE